MFRPLLICALVVALPLGAKLFDDETDPSPSDTSPVERRGPWLAAAADGTPVSLSWDRSEPRVGRASVNVVVGDGTSDLSAMSVDLVSPTMPAHGVLRSPVVGGAAEIDIPMEGDWVLCVNLDEAGTIAAQFAFGVPPEKP